MNSDKLFLGSTLDALVLYVNSDGGKKTSTVLNNRFLKDESSTSSRVLNHWENAGVIDDLRKNNKGWRKYSLMDLVWIYIVRELRKFNFSLNQLRDLKNELEIKPFDTGVSNMPVLELYIRHTLNVFKPVFLIVTHNCKYEIGFKNEIDYLMEKGLIKNHISINLNSIIKKVFPNREWAIEIEKNKDLSQEELEFITMLRTGRFNRIELESKDGKIKSINAHEVLKDKKKFNELYLEYEFQNIETVIHEGKITLQKRTVKKKY